MIVQECGVGLVPVRRAGELLSFAAPPLVRGGEVDAATRRSIVEITRVDPARVVDAQWVDNGPGWVALLLDDADAVLAAAPDASQHPGEWNIGLVGPIAGAGDERFEVRGFFTGSDGALREDPVTGSLNASAAQWMLRTGRAVAPYTTRQGTALGRRGRVRVSEDAGALWIGGRADVVVSGSVAL